MMRHVDIVKSESVEKYDLLHILHDSSGIARESKPEQHDQTTGSDSPKLIQA